MYFIKQWHARIDSGSLMSDCWSVSSVFTSACHDSINLCKEFGIVGYLHVIYGRHYLNPRSFTMLVAFGKFGTNGLVLCLQLLQIAKAIVEKWHIFVIFAECLEYLKK
jgi:hypothetical protein